MCIVPFRHNIDKTSQNHNDVHENHNIYTKLHVRSQLLSCWRQWILFRQPD